MGTTLPAGKTLAPQTRAIWGVSPARAAPAPQLAPPKKFARRAKVLTFSNPDELLNVCEKMGTGTGPTLRIPRLG